jgi:adenylate cyclase
MERINPLIGALDAVTAGKRDVRVEVGGSAEFARLAQCFNRMVEQLALAERMERAFGVYTSTQLFERIRAQHGEALMPTHTRWATVMFVDIRGFTEMSERLPPDRVVTVLNTFFAAAVEVVEQHDGFLNKFIGDSLMVVFNGPIDQPDHAERSVRCALGMHDAVARLNQAGAFAAVGELRTGVGIATGTMITGNIGSPRQMEYTVIGEVVNTAARLCAIAAGAETLVTQATAGALPATLPTRMLEPVTLKGKREAIAVARVEVLDADDAEHRCKDQRKERQGHQKISAVSPS